MLSNTLQVSPSFYGTGESYLFTFFPFFKVCLVCLNTFLLDVYYSRLF